MECLEDRNLLSILFGDTPGLTTSDNGGPVLSNAQVRLVFWGTGWSSNPTLQAQMQSSVDSLNSSTYFYSTLPGADLSQYRPGTAARPTRVASFNETDHSPGVTFSTQDVVNMLTQDFASAPGFYYYVVPDPNSTPSGPFDALHTFTTINGNRFYFGYSRNLATPSLDDLANLYSHEMAESITDPDGTALQVNPRDPSSWNEICDGQAQNYSYRLNGVLAQSYWSQADGKFTVPTGQRQNFLVSAGRVLTVNGDQLANHNDRIALDDINGAVRAFMNGETVQFEPGTISSVVINTRTGNDLVQIQGNRVPVTINLGDGTDTVEVGQLYNNLDRIQSSVTVHGGNGVDTLNVYDSANTSGQTYTMTASSVTRTGSALISYGDLFNFVNINGGAGNETYNVNGTESGYVTTLDTGPGIETVNVRATGSVSALNVNTTTGSGGGGNDVVTIGNAGSAQGILGAVTIFNDPSRDHVTIDDSADGANRNVTVGSAGVTGLAPAAINFTVFSVNTLSVLGGSGDNTYTASATPALNSVTLTAGSGNNTLVGPTAHTSFQIIGTNAGRLTSIALGVPVTFTGMQNLTGGSGNDSFIFADGAGVGGNISDNNGAASTLDYSAYSTPVTVDLSANSATGVGGSVTSIVTLRGGAGDDNLTGNTAGTTIFVASPGNDTITGLPGSINFLYSADANGTADSTWSVTGQNSGTLTFPGATTTFSGVQNLTGGGSGAATFVFADGAGVDGNVQVSSLSGGPNSLNYAAYSSTVVVDLQTHTGTGVGGSILNIQNVTGGTGGPAGSYNLLIGNGGNTLNGGTGRRNILVAGGTASTLNGGDQEDLLIAGFSVPYDTEAGLASWLQIAGYWAGTDDYFTRVANLTSGNGVPRLDASTVTGNGGGNTLNGTGELAWIFTDGADFGNGLFDPASQFVHIDP